MSSTPPTPLPTVWLLPPPSLLPSPHHPAIEPASLAISALLGSLALVFITTFLIRNPHKRNFLDGTSRTPEEEQAEKQLTISGPLVTVLRRNGNGNDGNEGNEGTGHLIPRLWSGFSSSNEEVGRVGQGVERRRVVELDNMPARMPDTSHNGMTAYPTYPVELDVLPRSPQGIHHRYPDTYTGRALPPPPPPKIPIPQHNPNPYTTNYNTHPTDINNNASSSRPTRLPPRNPRYSFGDDDTTVVGDKADVETLRSDLSFPDTDSDSDRGSDSASYEGRWKGEDVDGREVGLVGRHWE